MRIVRTLTIVVVALDSEDTKCYSLIVDHTMYSIVVIMCILVHEYAAQDYDFLCPSLIFLPISPPPPN